MIGASQRSKSKIPAQTMRIGLDREETQGEFQSEGSFEP